MITGDELFVVLSRKFPQLNMSKYDGSLEETMLCFADFTRQAAHHYDTGNVKTCLNTAAQLYLSGDESVKSTIERIYIPALRNMLHKDCSGGRLLKMHLPLSLYHLYITQAYK